MKTKYLSRAILFAQTHPKTAKTLASVILFAVVVLAFVNLTQIPTVYMSYSDQVIVGVVSADGHELPPVEPNGRYEVVWVK